MPIDESTTFEISTRGRIDDAVIERARERLGRVGAHCREPITHVELRITDDDHLVGQPRVRAEATLIVKRGPVRAHAQAPTVAEAVDAMIERLRRRLDTHESRLHRVGNKRHDGVRHEGSWQHGDVETTPRRPLPLLEEPAEVVRRKSFAAAPMTVEEAVFDLEILDHDFYLFEEAGSGATALISRTADGYQLAIAEAAVVALPFELPLERVDGPILLDLAAAERLLASGEQPFVFHRTAVDGPGQVLYRRYDGDFGIIELGESAGRS